MVIRSYYNGKWLNEAYQCCVRWMKPSDTSFGMFFVQLRLCNTSCAQVVHELVLQRCVGAMKESHSFIPCHFNSQTLKSYMFDHTNPSKLDAQTNHSYITTIHPISSQDSQEGRLIDRVNSGH